MEDMMEKTEIMSDEKIIEGMKIVIALIRLSLYIMFLMKLIKLLENKR